MNSGGGGSSHPLIDQTGTLGMADIALLEIIHGKMDYSMSTGTQEEEETHPVARKRHRS